MKQIVITLSLVFSTWYSAFASIYCDDCWEWGREGISINWTFSGGSDNCWSSYHSNNMYPWATAYIYQYGVLIDIVRSSSDQVRCNNYI
jgi:hypothetical protein